MDFTGRKCVPCHAGTPRIDPTRARELAAGLGGWQTDGAKLERRFQFEDFAAAMRFVNAMAEVAERENHHPDFLVHGWNKVDVTLSTHAIGGLSENDFIMASHIDRIPVGQG